MEKVKVSQKVADALALAPLPLLCDIPYIEKMAAGDHPDAVVAKTIYEYYTANKEDYFRCVVEGYEEVQSPEEKVKSLWLIATDIERNAIRSTVDALNIKIDGVNT